MSLVAMSKPHEERCEALDELGAEADGVLGNERAAAATPDESTNSESRHRREDMTGDVGAEIFRRVTIDSDREEHGLGSLDEGRLDSLGIQGIAFDHPNPRSLLVGQPGGRAHEDRYVVSRGERLLEAFAAESASRTEEGDLHAR